MRLCEALEQQKKQQRNDRNFENKLIQSEKIRRKQINTKVPRDSSFSLSFKP